MTNDQFEHLAVHLEDRARRSPALYQAQVLLLGLLGNVYLVGVLFLVMVALIALAFSLSKLGLLGVKLMLVVGAFLWIVVKAMWVKVDPPAGSVIEARQAPDLFAVIEDLRTRSRVPRVDHVLITDTFNAGIVQMPRFGIFGWPVNYLLIGLPLMKGLTIDQFKAVLAHEFGHLAKGHGRVSNWLYRQRLRWSRLMAMLDATASNGSFLFRPFLHWYAPYFNVYSFPLARANEYEADAAAARLSSRETVAEALTSVNVVGLYLAERFWPRLHKQADDLAQPNFAPYSMLGQSVATELDAASAESWLAAAMARESNSADTHPALADRLRAIGADPRLAPPAPGQASDGLLGRSLQSITESLDRGWTQKILPQWRARHREMQQGRDRLAALDAQVAAGATLTAAQLLERANLTESVRQDPVEALAQLRSAHDLFPAAAIVCFALGHRLLAREDAAGCALVERAIELEVELSFYGCALLRDYHGRNGRAEEAGTWTQRMMEQAQVLASASKERSKVGPWERLERHGLSADALADLRRQLVDAPGINKAYLARKSLLTLAQRPCYVLAFSVSGSSRAQRDQRAREALAHIQQTVQFPGETLIVGLNQSGPLFALRFSCMRRARIL